MSILNNTIKSVNSCIFDDGAKGLRIIGNKLTSLEGGSFRHTLVSRGPNQLLLSHNEHRTSDGNITIYLEGEGTAKIASENILSGAVDYGTVNVKTSID